MVDLFMYKLTLRSMAILSASLLGIPVQEWCNISSSSASANFYMGDGGALLGKILHLLKPKDRVVFWITPDAPTDAWTGLLFNTTDGRTPSSPVSPPSRTGSFKFRRVFPSYMFGSFDSTNHTSDMTKSVLEFSQNTDGSFVEKRTVGHADSTTTTFAGTTWTDLDTGKWDIFFYFEFAGDGVPSILKLRYQDEFPYRLIWAETMIFKPDGVEMHTTIAKENKHSDQLYSRRPSVKC